MKSFTIGLWVLNQNETLLLSGFLIVSLLVIVYFNRMMRGLWWLLNVLFRALLQFFRYIFVTVLKLLLLIAHGKKGVGGK